MIISREHFAMIFHHFQKIIESMGLCPEYKKKKEKIELMLNSFRNTYSVLYKCRVKFIISKATICLRDLQRSNIFVKLPLKTVHENFTLFLFEQKCTEYKRAWACVEFLKTLYGNDRLSFITTWKSFLTRAINSCQMKGSIPIPADVVRAH